MYTDRSKTSDNQPLMRISFFSCLIGALSVTASTHKPFSEFCRTGFTYGSFVHPIIDLSSNTWNTSVSSGDLCCDMCYTHVDNCMLAQYYPDTGDCEMHINNETSEEFNLQPPEYPEEEDKCSNGVSWDGGISQQECDLNHIWVGPCWDPVDLSYGIALPELPTKMGNLGIPPGTTFSTDQIPDDVQKEVWNKILCPRNQFE